MKPSRKLPSDRETRGSPTDTHDIPTLDLPTVDQLREKGASIRLLQQAQETDKLLGKQHRKHLRKTLAIVYAVASGLRADNDSWLDFCRHESWGKFRGRPRDRDYDNALKYAIRFMVGFGEKSATKRASKYYRALAPFFEDEVSPKSISKRIKEAGGIERLAAQNTKKQKSEQTSASGNPSFARKFNMICFGPAAYHTGKAKIGTTVLLTATILEQADNRTKLRVTRVKPL